ncbi:MAG: prepilin-type N-terminal cleavage/methylation domain-containing protein [Phycisphaerales bacterium]|nr:prepilin-type N-terminal cleavage/methylation domain-containing protein [Phycisphaerales bacterium]
MHVFSLLVILWALKNDLIFDLTSRIVVLGRRIITATPTHQIVSIPLNINRFWADLRPMHPQNRAAQENTVDTPFIQSSRHQNTRRGFSLIEILIVVIVLGILAAIVVPNFARAKDKSGDGIRKTHLRAVENALEQYYGKHDYYPVSPGWSGDAPNYGGKGYVGDNGYIPGLAPYFLKELPQDPTVTPTAGRGYLYRSDGKNYKFLLHQTPKTFDDDNPFVDPRRSTYSWAVYTSGGKNW